MGASKKPVVVLVGPTGVGKSEIAVQLALRLDGEIVTADSMQVYKGMDIGTAKPTPEEQRCVPHHLIDVVSPNQHFNVAMYRDLAHRVIAEIHERGRLPIVSGGTGLYIRAVLDEFLFPDQGADPQVRRELYELAERLGPRHLHERLREVDPQSAARLHPNDVRRVVRALEVFKRTGRTLSEQIAEARAAEPRYRAVRVGLTRPRKELYDRINRRVDDQLRRGLVDEVRRLREAYSLEGTAVQALGYKELFPYLDGECTLEEAVATLKRETRQYAKRQFTWFKRDTQIRWFDLSAYPTTDDAVEAIVSYVCTALPELRGGSF